MITRRKLWPCLLGAALLAFSCQREPVEPTGGETHFLRRCVPDSNDCGSQLLCLCGVCTRACDEPTACGDLPNAQCAVSCPQTQKAHCDVGCTRDSDCSALSGDHHCEQGSCRAGSACTPSISSTQQVVILGDSFFAATHQI